MIMETTIGGKEVKINDQGYLTDLSDWSREVAAAIAEEEGITLSENHWPIIEHLQEQHKQDVPLTIRKVGKSGIVDIKGFYALFPGGPLKKASRIAGIPKPASCI
jgi:TusE/DsrC/DsvC family sulfur relay protein